MYLKVAVQSVFEEIRDNLDFQYLNLPGQDNTLTDKYYIYDPALNFDDRLHKRLAYLNYEDREEPFISAMWNMSTVEAVTEQSRKFKGYITDEQAGISSAYWSKFLKTQLTLCFVSNDPYLLVDFEEQFATIFDRSFTLNPIYDIPIRYQNLGNITGVDITNKIFTISGVHDEIIVGDSISVINSSLNSGIYHISSISSTPSDTLITVSENIPSNTIDGNLLKNNGVASVRASLYFNNIVFNQIDKLDTTSRGEMTFLTISMDVSYPVLSLVGNSGSDNPYGKIIKYIHLRTKTSNNPKAMTASDMTMPYEEIIIQ